MKKNIIIAPASRLNFKDVFSFVHKNFILILLGLLFILGVFFGARFPRVSDPKLLHCAGHLFARSFQPLDQSSLYMVFTSSLSGTFVFVLATFFMGLSAWGCLIVPLIPLLRGFCIGFSEIYIYTRFGLKGALFHSAVLLPGLFISAATILLVSKYAFCMSKNIANEFFFERATCGDLREQIGKYISRTGLVLILAVASAVVDLLLWGLFSPFFSLN